MTFSLTTIRRFAAAVASVAMLTLPWSAIAQTASFSDGQLKSFAMAVAAINQIAEKWQPQVAAAQTEDQAAKMLEQVDIEMRQAIESTDGIGIDEYQTIMTAAQSDPALKSQIDTFLKQAGAQ